LKRFVQNLKIIFHLNGISVIKNCVNTEKNLVLIKFHFDLTTCLDLLWTAELYYHSNIKVSRRRKSTRGM